MASEPPALRREEKPSLYRCDPMANRFLFASPLPNTASTAGRSGQKRVQELSRMDGGFPGEMLDLHPTRKARRHDDSIGIGRPDGREQPLLADLPRNLVVLLFVPERPRHTTAAGIEIDNFGAWN